MLVDSAHNTSSILCAKNVCSCSLDFLSPFILKHIEIDDPAATSGNDVLQKYSKLNLRTFRYSPNLFDALTPPVLAKQLLKIQNIAYEPLTNDPKFTRIKNAFSSDAPTKPSTNSVMRLADPRIPVANYQYFSGVLRSPITEILRANGYSLHNGYANAGLGFPGKHLTLFPSSVVQFLQPFVIGRKPTGFFWAIATSHQGCRLRLQQMIGQEF